MNEIYNRQNYNFDRQIRQSVLIRIPTAKVFYVFYGRNNLFLLKTIKIYFFKLFPNLRK